RSPPPGGDDKDLLRRSLALSAIQGTSTSDFVTPAFSRNRTNSNPLNRFERVCPQAKPAQQVLVVSPWGRTAPNSGSQLQHTLARRRRGSSSRRGCCFRCWGPLAPGRSSQM